MWRHYNIILENSDITRRPWQRLAIIEIFSALTWYETLVLNIKGKVNKIAINTNTTLYEQVCQWIVTDQSFYPSSPVSSTNEIATI
jgi:hypothetical protein